MIDNPRSRGWKATPPTNPSLPTAAQHEQDRIMLGHDHDPTGSPTRGMTAEPNPLCSWDACEGKVGKRRTRIPSERMRDNNWVSQWRGYPRELLVLMRNTGTVGVILVRLSCVRPTLSHTNGTVCGAENHVCFDCCPEVAAQRDNANLFNREQVGGLARWRSRACLLGLGKPVASLKSRKPQPEKTKRKGVSRQGDRRHHAMSRP